MLSGCEQRLWTKHGRLVVGFCLADQNRGS
jgi:hypothetical protein